MAVTRTKPELARLRAYRRALFERITARAEPFEHGVAVFTPAHPTKWDLNLLIVDDASGVTAEELIAEAERLQAPAGLRHRKIEAAAGRRTRSWTASRRPAGAPSGSW